MVDVAAVRTEEALAVAKPDNGGGQLIRIKGKKKGAQNDKISETAGNARCRKQRDVGATINLPKTARHAKGLPAYGRRVNLGWKWE